jgi:two-component system, OmpR family, phosphate regulon sensor histidine kinase PhoR
MKLSQRQQGFLWFCTVLLILALTFTLAFFLTGWLYHLTGLTPSPLLAQLITSMGGLFLTALFISVVSRVFKSKFVAGQMRAFGPIIDALRRIAKGDFSVRVDNVFDDHDQGRSGILGELVNSVNQMAVELDQMETMRQEFISNVSHEIQSPLTSIRGFARALHSEHLSADERNHYLTIIETESARLSKITENLLKLASLEAEHPRFEPKPYRLDKQIRSLILTCEPQWTAKALGMDVCLEEVEAAADEDLMSQVWTNLLANSIKFTPQGGKIRVDLRRQDGQIVFKICDTGIGISEADQAHVFERFYKADRSRTHSNNGGSGLGLSIVQKIVQMHNGTIALESQVGAGTTFTVTLPVN